MTEAARIYCVAALELATRRNVLTLNEREAFRLSLENENEAETLSWASLVVYDISTRCKSFVLPEVIVLTRLGHACGAL